jgi:hypothetical protein
METLPFYFPIGWEHILSRDALDHQAFLAAMGACFLLPDWKKLLVVITAFTVGHSLTLALSVLSIISVDSQWVELLIPVTIALTAWQQWRGQSLDRNKTLLLYSSALGFGFIHGMGFANNIRFMLSQDQSWPRGRPAGIYDPISFTGSSSSSGAKIGKTKMDPIRCIIYLWTIPVYDRSTN